MWKELWQKWTVDRPAALGDWLWDVFVVQLAALLDRLTLRRIIALIPLVIVILAYAHRLPLPPELVLLGDFFAYIDVLSVLLVLSVVSRIAPAFFLVKEATALTVRLANGLLALVQRADFRHRREGSTHRKRLFGRTPDEDERVAYGFAWA
jgi:hypothetical protein